MSANDDRLEELWRDYLSPLVLYALRRSGSQDDAMDVVAEVYLVAWRRIDRVPAGPEARLWLFTVARNVMANQRRGQLRRTRLAERLTQEIQVNIPVCLTDRDGVVEMGAALAALSERNRELIILVAHDGLTPSDAAQVLGIPAATARVRLHRARAQLRTQMQRSPRTGHVQSGSPLAAAGTENLEVI